MLVAIASRASGQIALVLVTLVATRFLTPAQFGTFAIAAALVTLSRTMLYAGPFEFLLKATESDLPVAAAACLRANGIVAAGWCAALVALGLAVPFLLSVPQVGFLLFVLAPSNAFAALAGWQESLILRRGAVSRYYAVTVASEIVAGACAVWLLGRGWGLLALAAQVHARLLVQLFAYRLLVQLPGVAPCPRGAVAKVLRWSVGRYGSVFVTFCSNYGADLLLGMMLSPAATGVYRAGNRVVTALSDMFTQPAGLLATATLSAERVRGAAPDGQWLRLATAIAALAWPALGMMALLAQDLAPWLLGQQWQAVGPVIAVFCVARMAAVVSAVAVPALVVHDRQGLILRIQFAGSVGTIALTSTATPFGVTAVAVAAAAVAVATGAVLAAQAWRAGGRTGGDTPLICSSVGVPLAGALAGAAAGRGIAVTYLFPATYLVVFASFCGIAGWATCAFALRHRLLAELGSLAGPERHTEEACRR